MAKKEEDDDENNSSLVFKKDNQKIFKNQKSTSWLTKI